MKIVKNALIILLLTYVSGTFSLQRLDFGITLEIRYILIILYLLTILAFISIKMKSIKIRVSVSLFLLVFTLIVYIAFQLFSLTYTPDLESGILKIFDFIFLLILVVSILVSINHMNIETFYRITSYFFVILGVIYVLPILLSILSGAERGDVLLSGPNVATRIIFFALCSSFYLHKLTKKNIYIILMVLFFSTIIIIGSRGGFIAAIIILIIAAIIRINFRDKLSSEHNTFKKVLLIPIIVVLAFILYNPVMRVFEERFINTTFSNGELYTSGRDSIYEIALNLITINPLMGHGVASFTSITGYVYPHNLLLEMTLEVGLIGIFSFLVFLYYSFIVIKKWSKSKYFIFSLLPLYMILVQMFSGEFYDFRYFFLWIIPLLVKKE